MSYGESLLSKIIDTNNPQALVEHGIEPYHFHTESEREALKFIQEYAESNGGQAPDFRTVAAEIEGFNYLPNIEDSTAWLARKVKDGAGKRMLYEFLTGPEVGDKYERLSTEEFSEWIAMQTEQINRKVGLNKKVGIDLKKDTENYLAEYKRRKLGKSFKIWQSKFPTMNDAISGYLSGNMYTWYGRSGRGKSVFVMEEALEAAMQGANVLVWALEMSWFEWMSRAYASLSGRQGVVTSKIDGIDYDAGFQNRELLTGQLDPEFEDGFKQFLKDLPGMVKGNITLRAVDDETFYRRDIKQLKADIIATKADVVVVDPIYYMDYESNTSRTAGGDAAATSKKLRHLAGQTQTVIHVITQADEDKKEKNEEGTRELKAPSRAEIKKTKAVLEDANAVFGIDTLDGRGIVEIGKGRSGGEGDTIEVVYLPNYGIVREMETGEVAAEQFEKVF